jgi:hypothetical protein
MHMIPTARTTPVQSFTRLITSNVCETAILSLHQLVQNHIPQELSATKTALLPFHKSSKPVCEQSKQLDAHYI